MNKKAIIAMSGGVDSSVAALLMQQKGYECIGVTMKLFGAQDDHSCCSARDIEDARKICAQLGMEYFVSDFAARFDEEVIARFVQAYTEGRTPNPCVDCNRYLKFGQLFARAQELGADYVVTGHYARVTRDEKTGRYLLRKAFDPLKDQSYVLYSLNQEQLAHAYFPLGELEKTAVRAIAEQNNFLNARKHDSQDICFVKNESYADFIERRTGRKFAPGNFVDTDGKILGTHKGIIHYTIGQRKGLGLALPEPMYVKNIDVSHNAVVLSTNAGLFTKNVTAKNINLIDCERIEGTRRVKARIRYRQKEQLANVTQPDADTLELVFDEPQRAVTKGQSLVLYDGDIVVGGGTIV